MIHQGHIGQADSNAWRNICRIFANLRQTDESRINILIIIIIVVGGGGGCGDVNVFLFLSPASRDCETLALVLIFCGTVLNFAE